ncbi:MAG: glycosyl hydrolase [Gammaproteobacteria bacterium]|nr:glycosyl hydrolase [Gammaproteobacteria bacterium]
MTERVCQFVRLSMLLLAATLPTAVQADIDPETFADEIQALQWREVGPYRGGRSAAVAGIPSQDNVYYFGATGGGVWKTKDAGQSWHNVSDGYFGGSIGAVAVSEWDPNVVYVGGGEKTVRGNVSPGTGMWKSTDAGETWRRIGLRDTQHISRIRIHPRDPDLVYVAAMGHLFGSNDQRGVYRSRDGGSTWDRVLFANKDAGAVDLVLDPTNPRIVYASTWRVRRTPYSLESGGEGSALYKSVDGGDSWARLSDNKGFPAGPLGIIGIAVSPANNQNLYAMVEAGEGGLFRSSDGGTTWTRVNDDRNLRQRAWYYTRVYADPADEESVYVLNVRFHFSKDGGKTFSEIDTPHGDNHDLWIDPANPLRMIQANDGGANVSFNRGETWSTQSNQPTAQFYRVSIDNDFPYRLLGGQQDNTAVRIRSRSSTDTAIGLRDWEPTAGGESGHIVAKPDNPDIVVGGSYGGYLQLFDHGTGQSRSIDVWPDNPMGWGAADLRYRFQWNFPILFSRHDPDVLIVGANMLFRSDDLGQSWQAISPDLTRNDRSRLGPSGGPITKDNTSVEYYATVFAIAESIHEKDAFWVGTDDGRVHITRNGGTTWTDVTPSNMPEWAQINSIDIHPFEVGGAYLAATRYKSDDFAPYIFRTDDWGRSWRRIVGGIPRDQFTRVVRADPDREGLLYAGTEGGIYYSLDDGASWQSLQLNLPLTPVTDLAIKDDDLVAATQGRGFWILDDLTVLHQLSDEHSGKKSHLYKPRQAVRISAPARRSSERGNRGQNPPAGAIFHYSLGDDVTAGSTISLEVFPADPDSQAIWAWTRKPVDDDAAEEDAAETVDTRLLTSDKGLNRFVWDLRYPGMERFEDIILWGDMKEGPYAVPGIYRVRLTVDGQSSEEFFEVAPDPRVPSTQDDFLQQFRFVMECRDLLSRTHNEITRVRQLRAQLEALAERLEDADDEGSVSLTTAIREAAERMTAIEETLYQTNNESRQDPLNFPIRLNNKLSIVMRLVAAGDFAPTTQAYAVKQELTAAITEQLARLQVIWEQDLPLLNARIAEHGIDLIALPAD